MRLGNGTQITSQARDALYEYFHNRFRLGELSGVELANEARGVVVAPTEADGNAVRYSNMTFGQGLDATMLQVSAGFSSIINGGNYYKPTVLAGEMINGQYKPNAAATPAQAAVIQPTTSNEVRDTVLAGRITIRTA